MRLMLIILAAVGICVGTPSSFAGRLMSGESAGYCNGGHWVWTGGWGLLGPGWGYYLTPDYVYVRDYCVPEDTIKYCMRRFKSYNPRTGTYLGYDGYRHPCP